MTHVVVVVIVSRHFACRCQISSALLVDRLSAARHGLMIYIAEIYFYCRKFTAVEMM